MTVPRFLAIIRSPSLLVAVLSAAVAIFLSPFLLEFVLPLRRPVQDWMVAHGLGAFAGEYGLLNLRIPSIFLSLLGGFFLGNLFIASWVRFAMLFASAIVMGPWLAGFATGALAVFTSFDWRVVLVSISWDVFTVLPSTLAAAWLGATFGKRRHFRNSNEKSCKRCGYNLTGNASGRCPECGTVQAIPPPASGREVF